MGFLFIFIFIIFFVSNVHGWKATIYNEKSYQGLKYDVEGTECKNLDHIYWCKLNFNLSDGGLVKCGNTTDDQLSSIDIKSNCLRLYEHKNCEGKNVVLSSGKSGHEDLGLQSFNGKASSIGPSDYLFRVIRKENASSRQRRAPAPLGFGSFSRSGSRSRSRSLSPSSSRSLFPSRSRPLSPSRHNSPSRHYSPSRPNSPKRARIADSDSLISGRVPGLPIQHPTRTGPIKEYQTGFQGRAEYVQADITRDDLRTGTKVSSDMRRRTQYMGDGPKDHTGHIIAKRFGGPGDEPYNTFPQTPKINQGEWRSQVENKVADVVQEHGRARLTVNPRYKDSTDLRPNELAYKIERYDKNIGDFVEVKTGTCSNARCISTPAADGG